MNNNNATKSLTSINLNQDLLTNLDNGNNTFNFRFTRNITTTDTSRIGIANFSVPYSWFNITAAIGNNTLGYVWYDSATSGSTYGGGSLEVDFTIPDGYYNLANLNSYLQFIMIQQGHYLVDAAGNFVYFLEIVENESAYRDQINSYLLPSALPSGWQIGLTPGGVQTIHLSGGPNAYPFSTPKLLLSDTNRGTSTTGDTSSLFVYLGFKETGQTSPPTFPYTQCFPDLAHSYPYTGYNSQSIIGDLAPAQTLVHSICLTCNYVDNPLRTTAQHAVSTFVVTTQNIIVKFGENINSSNNFTTWIPLLQGQTISQMKFALTDQDGDPVLLQDPDSNIDLFITDIRY